MTGVEGVEGVPESPPPPGAKTAGTQKLRKQARFEAEQPPLPRHRPPSVPAGYWFLTLAASVQTPLSHTSWKPFHMGHDASAAH